MKTFRISAKVVSYVAKDIDAADDRHAIQMLETLLEQGAMPEVDGWVEEEQVQEIKGKDTDPRRCRSRLR